METFIAILALCDGNPPVTGGFPSQRPVTVSFDDFFFICAWTNGLENNRNADYLRRHHVDSLVIGSLSDSPSANLVTLNDMGKARSVINRAKHKEALAMFTWFWGRTAFLCGNNIHKQRVTKPAPSLRHGYVITSTWNCGCNYLSMSLFQCGDISLVKSQLIPITKRDPVWETVKRLWLPMRIKWIREVLISFYSSQHNEFKYS